MVTSKNDKRGKYQMPVIDKLGLADDVLGMLKDNVSYSQISTILKGRGIKLSVASIGKWVRTNKRMSLKPGKTKMATVKKFETLCLNYQNEIGEILEEVKQVKQVAKDGGNLNAYANLVGKLYQGLELLAKLMGDIRPNGSVDINLIINEINQNSFETHKDKRHNLFKNSEIFDIEADIIGEEGGKNE